MNLIKGAILTSSCVTLILIQVFYPYYHYTYIFKTDNKLTVGVIYWYELDDVGIIFDSIRRLKDMGVKVIRVNLYCNPDNYASIENNKTEALYNSINYFGGITVSLVVPFQTSENYLRYYLNNWGKYLSYVQILNEPELTTSWAEGAYYLDDEIINKFLYFKNITDSYNLTVKYYVNFSPAFLLRASIVTELSKYLDFVGLDTYMLGMSFFNPRFYELLKKLSGKEVIISEFGSCSQDESEQSNYIINSLEMFKNMGIKQAWIVSWNGENGDASMMFYSIRDKLAEREVADWIARNS